jgi:hypothetical protein
MKTEMNQNSKWDEALDRQLKNLPLLKAPPNVAARVLDAVARHQQAWYRQSWQYWSLPLQIGSVLALSLVFAGICFVAWKAPAFGPVASSLDTLRTWAATGGVWLTALLTLLDACWLAIKNLGTGFLIGCLVSAGLAYATFVGFGTVYLRLALPRR